MLRSRESDIFTSDSATLFLRFAIILKSNVLENIAVLVSDKRACFIIGCSFFNYDVIETSLCIFIFNIICLRS